MNLFKTKNIEQLKEKALYWASSFNTCCYLDTNHYDDLYGSDYDCIIAVDVLKELIVNRENAFEQLKQFHEAEQKNLFGFLTYDLKNQLEELQSNNSDHCHFPLLYFFTPKIEIRIKGEEIIIISNSPEIQPETIYSSIEDFVLPIEAHHSSISVQPRISKENYLAKVEKIRDHIHRGDIYELNLCQEFYAEKVNINPVHTYQKLKKYSPTPFSAFFKQHGQYVLCASPERYLRKKGSKIISQPIKGTIRRSEDPTEDKLLKQQLYNDPKERAENVMIVDLVRNDLTRCAQKNSVKVEELFGVYSFNQVHQLISTVSANLKPDLSPIVAIKTTFPMGSMTGAPKIRAMQLIEEYEETLRGVYSGAIGYITRDGDFDFNVVIRSIIYNSTNQYLSFQVGGAITYNSVAEKEYEECLLKAKAIMDILK